MAKGSVAELLQTIPGIGLLTAKRRAKGDLPLTRLQGWAVEVDRRRGHNKATIAVANKLTRIVWATWTRAEAYDDTLHQQAA